MVQMQLWLFVVLDLCFFGTLGGMSSCMSQSRLAYVSDWIMECKRSGTSQQVIPVLVAAMFVLIVLWQLDWMLRVSFPKQPPSLPTTILKAPHAMLVGAGITAETVTTTHASAKPAVGPVLNAAVVSCKLAAVFGIILVFMYDHEYATEHRGFVYTHYYGVVLLCVGLTGLMQTTWLQLELTKNRQTLSREPMSSSIHELEEGSFYAGDVFLLVVVIVFFTSTLLAGSDNNGSMHNAAVISEFLVLGLLWAQLIYLFGKCWPLDESELMEWPSNAHRFAVAFVVLMIPYAVMQSL
jgi:hypothetical protein